MPFLFSHVCDLLQQVEDLPLACRSKSIVVHELIHDWFEQHRATVDALVGGKGNDVDVASASASAAALLSTLLPDQRTDRVYGLQARTLQRAIIRALGLGQSRIVEISRWNRPAVDGGSAVDLADCVEAILKQTPNPAGGPPLSIEEIDSILTGVAVQCRFSSPAIRQAGRPPVAAAGAGPGTRTPSPSAGSSAPLTRDRAVGRLYRRLSARDAKWLTRLILKDYRPVVLDPAAIVREFHPDLPLALRVHSDFLAAVQSLRQSNAGEQGEQTEEGTGGVLQRKPSTPSFHCPRLGVKVGRQPWAKARSIKHCMDMAGPRRMTCERKMDGEYVQLHVDLSKGLDNCLQIFSKSGKDSTQDRIELHGAIRASLRLGQADCILKAGCILEGEMLAYSKEEDRILDFDAIRKHVTRSGMRLYGDASKDALNDEHLMVVYYDLLFIDGESLLQTRHEERFRRMEELITQRAGYAELVHRKVIDFGRKTAAAELRQTFARCVADCHEGLVIKADGDAYFDFSSPKSTPLVWPYMRCFAIKLKKGYVGGFGELGDFALVGGRYDAIKAKEYPSDLAGLRWTHFFIASLKSGWKQQSRPRFVVTNVVSLNVAQMRTFLTQCRPSVVPAGKKKNSSSNKIIIDTQYAPFDLDPLESGIDESRGGPTELFTNPPVVEIRCFAFHRQGFGHFWSPRFASVTKFHFDRTYTDAMTYDELQTVATDESLRKPDVEEDGLLAEDGDAILRNDPAEELDSPAQETEHWVSQLKRADSGGVAVDADTSQSETDSCPSPELASQETSALPNMIPITIDLVSDKDSQTSKTTASTTLTETFQRTADAAESTQPPELAGLPELVPLPSSPGRASTCCPSSSLPRPSSPLVTPRKASSQPRGSSQDDWNREASDTDTSSVERYSKKHLFVCDVADMYPIVSPPKLKRPKRGNSG